MTKLKSNLVDVSRLYTLKAVAEATGNRYTTMYKYYVQTQGGIARKPFDIVEVNGAELIYMSPEKEKDLKREAKMRAELRGDK